MKKLAAIFVIGLITSGLIAQDPEGNYNPYVNSGVISPAPLLPVEMSGTGTISFNFGNTGSDPCEVFPGHQITLVITLSGGEPDNVNPLSAISGGAAGLFSWSYDGGTYTGTQSSTVTSGFVGTISIDYKVTQNSPASGTNGFNINITPAPYQNTSNSPNDDAVSSYTYTEYRDYSDAPASYGSADHNIDFENYLGAFIDGEDGPQYSSLANGDDIDGNDDEDGIDWPAEIVRGSNIDLPITVTGVGRLNGWIDWNGNGSFEEGEERIASNLIFSQGTSNLSFSVPADAIITGPTFARFRYSPTSLTTSRGSVEGGEVEDYQISIQCTPPSVSIVSDAPGNTLCDGTPVTFTGGGGILYTFRINGIEVQSGTSTSFTTTLLDDGDIVDVVVTDALGCSGTSVGISITVLPRPNAILLSDDADNTFCDGTTITFSTGGGSNYQFFVDDVSVQNGPGANFSTSSLNDGQNVYVIVTGNNSCIDTSINIVNTVFELPIATLQSSDADNTICDGEELTFSASGGISYEFRINGIQVQSGSVNTYATSNLLNEQTVDVIVSNANGCSAVSDGISTIVNSLPIVNAGDPLAEICGGESTASLNGSFGGSATGVVWSSSAGGTFLPNANSVNASWTPPAGYSGTSTLSITSIGGLCGSVTSEVSQVVNPAPVLVISNPDPICPSSFVDIGAGEITNGSTPGLTLSYWSDAGATQEYPTPEATNEGTYYIMGTNLQGCSDVQPVVVTAFPTPTAPQLSTTTPTNLCPEDFVNLTSLVISSTPSGGSLLYQLNNDPLGTAVPEPTSVGAGTYYLFYQSSDGCFSTGSEVAVLISSCPPDVTPTITVSPNVMNGLTDFNLIVRITELNEINTLSPIVVKIPKDSRWILRDGFDNSLATLGGTILDNGNWSYTEDDDNHIFQYNSLISASDYSSFGFVVTFDPGSSRGTYTITSQIESGGGGETRVNNNVDSEKIDYFQE